MNIFLFLLYVVLSAGGLVLFKIGSSASSITIDSETLKMDINLFLLLGVIFYILSFLLYLYLVSKSNLSYIYAMSIGCINLIILLCSVFLLKENISVMQIIGSMVIVVGVILTNWRN